MTSFRELAFWNNPDQTYGKAIRIKKRTLRALFTALCLATPGTNWLLIFLPKVQDLVVRW